MSFPNVADLSSAQRSFDAAAYAASGRVAVIIKSTESTTYHFATGDAWEQQAIAHGLVVGRYHWAGSSLRGTIESPDVEGAYFLRFNGAHTPGRFAACDMENPLPGHGPALYGMSAASAAAWVDEFLDFIAQHGGWPGLGYSFSGSGVVQRIRHAKWPASYPTLTVPGAALHQFSSSAPVPGVGSCDDSHCFIDLRAFAGASPTPIPQPQGDEPVGAFPLPPLGPGQAYAFRPPPANHTGGVPFGDVWVSFPLDTLDGVIRKVPLRFSVCGSNGKWTVFNDGANQDEQGLITPWSPAFPPLVVDSDAEPPAVHWDKTWRKASLVHCGRKGVIVPLVEYVAG